MLIVMIVLDSQESAIRRGIKTVGVGKKGSKPLTAELAQEIFSQLKEGKVTPAEKGAFFGSLVMKGLSESELILAKIFPPGTLGNPIHLAKTLAPDTPEEIQKICARLLNKEEMDKATAKNLGDFLLSELPGDGARGLVASILRVRYETPDEYEGLLQSINDSIEPEFKTAVQSGPPIIQMAEPFDCVDHSYMITPLVGEFLQTLNYRVVFLVGRNSGPKFGNNLLDIAECLNSQFLKSTSELSTTNSKPNFGYFLHQKNISKAMDRWVDIRHQTIKRPFMATLERFPNSVNAHICLVSAFHPPYGEKMLTIAERADYPAVIVIRNGIEGTIAAPLLRAVKILCSVRQNNGTYLLNEMNFEPTEFIHETFQTEEMIEYPSPKENVRLVEEFHLNGKTNNPLFDSRVKLTCEVLRKMIEWIEQTVARD